MRCATKIFLWPFLFLIYVNDLPNAVDCTTRLFADNTCLIFQAFNSIILQGIINTELKNLNMWYCSNKLTVNPAKSNVAVISSKSTHNITQHLMINNDSSQNHTGKSTQYLRVIIDNKLNFYEQIKVLECKNCLFCWYND